MHGYKNCNTETAATHATNFYSLINFGVFTGAFMCLESYVRAIHLALDQGRNAKRDDSIYKHRKSLYDNYRPINFPQVHEYFKLMQTLRNCIHNQGVYFSEREPKLAIYYKGSRFDFLNGFPPNCLQPYFLLDRIEDAVKIIAETSSHPLSQKIIYLEDHYEKLGVMETQQ